MSEGAPALEPKKYERASDAVADAFLKERGIDCSAIAASLDHYKDQVGMVKDLARLAFELRDKIPGYELILSDDASGRLPAWMFWKLINEVRGGEKTRAQLRGFAGGKGIKWRLQEVATAIQGYLSQISPGAPVLLITEVMETGISLIPPEQVVRDSGHPLDIAVVHVSPHGGLLRWLFKTLHFSTPVFERTRFGGDERVKDMPFDNDMASGLYAEPWRPSAHAQRDQYADPAHVEAARKDMNKIAQALVPMFR